MQVKQSTNNYDACRRQWRIRFLSMDHDALLKRLPFLHRCEEGIIVPYFIWHYTVLFSDGRIVPLDHAPVPSMNDEMNIYTLLWYSKASARFLGDWLPFEQLKNASPYGPAFRRGNLISFAQTFSGHADALRRSLIAMGGKKISAGDVGYEIDVFPCIPMRVLFWEVDDEFPAQANLLFDRSITDFIHVESVVTIASQAQIHLNRMADI